MGLSSHRTVAAGDRCGCALGGADRWRRRAAATGLDEATLRAGAARTGGDAQAAAEDGAQIATISVPASIEEMVRPAAGTRRSTSWGV